jgi:thioredoxin reductase
MRVIIVGDGPGGLSAALFLAKNGMEVTVFGQDETAMHHAMLYNYLGVPEISGSDFQQVARAQVERFGVEIRASKVNGLAAWDDGIEVETADGERHQAAYLVLAEGKAAALARELGLAEGEDGIEVDRRGRTAFERVYVVGRSTNRSRSQAIVSAGEGASAALDILSREAGKDVCDFDTPPSGDD